MKTIYLIQKEQVDGKSVLSPVSAEEWKAVVSKNKGLSIEEKRYFIADCIEEGNTIDRMVIEVSLSEYRCWNSKHTLSERSRKRKKEFVHLSLDAELFNNDELCLADCIAGEDSAEESALEKMSADELCKRLSAWKPWAIDVLNMYLCGKKTSCTSELAKRYGVSEQVIRKYKRQFEEFIKKYLDGVSF